MSVGDTPRDFTQRAQQRYRLAADGLSLRVFLSFRGSRVRYPVGDISRSGLSFVTDDPVPEEYLEKAVDALIHLGGRSVVLRIRPVNKTGNRVGCRIERFPPKWEREFANFIDPLSLGAALRVVREVPVDADAFGNLLSWYRAPFACDLFAWIAPAGQVVVAQLLFRKYLVQWSAADGLSTALVRNQPRLDETFSPSSVTTYTPHRKVNRELVAFAQRLLAPSPDVPEHVKAVFSHV